LLDTDKSVRAYMDGESTVLPEFYLNRIKSELGSLYQWLPEGGLEHDPNAYLKSTTESSPLVKVVGKTTAGTRRAEPKATAPLLQTTPQQSN
jgi:hypothetical protein